MIPCRRKENHGSSIWDSAVYLHINLDMTTSHHLWVLDFRLNQACLPVQKVVLSSIERSENVSISVEQKQSSVWVDTMLSSLTDFLFYCSFYASVLDLLIYYTRRAS